LKFRKYRQSSFQLIFSFTKKSLILNTSFSGYAQPCLKQVRKNKMVKKDGRIDGSCQNSRVLRSAFEEFERFETVFESLDTIEYKVIP